MPNLFDPPNPPGLQTSSSSWSSAGSNKEQQQPKRNDQQSPPEQQPEPPKDWSQEEQDQFIALILPFIQGKSLSPDDIELIREEAQQAQLPLECVDRLIAENSQQPDDNNPSIQLMFPELEDAMEDVDESDNILAYFSRMSTLKQGGHFPRLNTEAIGEFVSSEDTETYSEEVEVDLDVGYVNKSLNIMPAPFAEYRDDEDMYWGVADEEDTSSQISTAVADHRNRYDSSAFETLLVGGISSSRSSADQYEDPTVTTPAPSDEEQELDSIEQERQRNVSLEATLSDEADWAPPTARPGKTYRYGYERDLAEWRRKRDIALWQPSDSHSTSFLTCHAMAEAVVADELLGLFGTHLHRPPRLRGMTAVRTLLSSANERRKRRQERNRVRHVPETAQPKAWQLPYGQRCKECPGYMGVDQHSLMDTAAAKHPTDPRDPLPWESRNVLQHFLHEQSIGLSRNWFGRLRRKSGNDLIKYNPCRPPTMGMPIGPSVASITEFDDDDCEWTNAGASKNTASRSTWKSTISAWRSYKRKEKQDDVNKTASMSFTSGENDDGTRSGIFDDDESTNESTRYTRDTHSSRLELDFSSIMSSIMTTTTGTYSNLKHRDHYGVAWLSDDDDESAGVSAILDAEDEHSLQQKPSTVASATTQTDRYVSSFSESTRSDCSSSSGSYCTGDSESTSSYWEDSPACGTLVNVKPKLGERVSRVTPDHTSHLLRSRFRKKYLARAGIPFDK